jgi:hypothetical protein
MRMLISMFTAAAHWSRGRSVIFCSANIMVHGQRDFFNHTGRCLFDRDLAEPSVETEHWN